jgi:PAS domain S-box-containing protein
VLSVVLAVFTAQFIYQMHGMFEMHFFTFIGSTLLITYQKWKLQVPLLIFVLVHHLVFSRLQDAGYAKVYFSQLSYFDLQTLVIHILLTTVICLISGLCAFQLHKYHRIQLRQAAEMDLLQEDAHRLREQQKHETAMEERNTILESIGDAFFAVDQHWVVTYWNKMAEKVLYKPKKEMLNQHLWTVFETSVGSESYRQYHHAVDTGQAVHFEDYFAPLDKWYEVSAYPSVSGLSVYFKDITGRKQATADLEASEKRYSDVFHFSPLPMWVANLESLQFLDVNQAMITHYGYSREELLTMTLRDIRPASEISSLEKGLEQGKTEPFAISRREMIHRKKDGGLMNMEIQLAPFLFKGTRTSIVIAQDITERLSYVKAIEEQNEKLHAISWMQSHVIRAPLARIMGLLPMFRDPKTSGAERQKITGYLIASADELDDVIRRITDVTGAAAAK